MAEQAANVLLPTGGAGGLALGAWALRRIGMPADRIGPPHRRLLPDHQLGQLRRRDLRRRSASPSALLPGEVALADRRSSRRCSPQPRSPRSPLLAARARIGDAPRLERVGSATALAKGRGYLPTAFATRSRCSAPGGRRSCSGRSATWLST